MVFCFFLYNNSMKKYQVIYSDPPWRYDFSKSDSRKIENQYPTMTVDEICDMKIPIDDNAVLYLWATAPKLEEALKVMKAWKMNYKSHMIWNKVKVGMGYWFRGQHELLLVGTKGKLSPPIPSLRIGSVFVEDRGIHSKKPDKIRRYISLWYPNKNKLEIFAREKVLGWDVFGNEVKSDIKINTTETPKQETDHSFEKNF